MQTQPFSRVNQLVAVASALASYRGISLQAELDMQPQYRSKGKGRGETPKSRHGKHMDHVRHARSLRNKNKRSR